MDRAMNSLARTAYLVVVLFLFSSHASAQSVQDESKTPPPVPPQTFTSLEGRFTIALPQQVSGFRGITTDTPKGRVTLGDAYSWRLPNSQYEVGYIDPTLTPNFSGDGKAFVDGVAVGLAAQMATKNGKLLSNVEIPVAGGYGREVKLEFSDFFYVQRIYLVNQRMYQVAVGFKKDANPREETAKILDSFKVLTPAEVEAARQKQIAEASPSPLPQEPVAKRLKSDAEDEGLRGRVKTVFTESEDLSGTWSVQGRKPSAMEYYNGQGNLTKREFYDYKGNLDTITVYGYLDGERASHDKSIEQEYNPPPMMVAPAPGGQKPKYDPRYHYKFKFKYDDKGRLVEKTWYSNDGKLWMKYAYNYKGDQKEELVYAEDGSLNQKYLYTLDDKGNETEEVIYETRDDSVRSKNSYSYEFDAQGNWIKRTTSKWATKDGKQQFVPDSVTYRAISYY
jgi:hypothetical protein